MGQGSRIGIDTGGTFTDVVRLGSRRIATKVPSTPDDPARAVLEGLEAVGGLPAGGHLHHGSTVGTNAVLTRSGARVLFVATDGFADLLHLDRGQRRELHALVPDRALPLVALERCLGVRGRTDASGRVVRPTPASAPKRVCAAVRRTRAEAVAVCLLHAVVAPAEERALTRALRQMLAGSGVSVHASAEVSADAREAERAATTVLDAYAAPAVARYVARLANALPAGALTIMRSDGGRMSPAEVARSPVRTLLSGPAGGVAAAHAFALRHGVERALSFDVGGTSTDVAWLEGDDLPVEGELRVGDHRASVPSLAVETVGAGGGSVVRLDEGGALRVGPESAGAEPGPACYGRGGPLTLTDVWLLLDRLPPEGLLAGAFALDRAAAEQAARVVAREAGCSLRAVAHGAVRVAAATTARALRRASVARGHDPRGAALVAFGGAGALLAAETAVLLDLHTALVPSDPGTFAAEGTLLAPLRADQTGAVTRTGSAALTRLRRSLSREVEKRLAEQGARRVVLRAEVDARYAGQAFEVTVPLEGSPDPAERFHALHAQRYGFADPAAPVELVRLRVRGAGFEERARRRMTRGSDARAAPFRPIDEGRVLRSSLDPGDALGGPLRIEERTGTTWVPDGFGARVLADRALRLERRA